MKATRVALPAAWALLALCVLAVCGLPLSTYISVPEGFCIHGFSADGAVDKARGLAVSRENNIVYVSTYLSTVRQPNLFASRVHWQGCAGRCTPVDTRPARGTCASFNSVIRQVCSCKRTGQARVQAGPCGTSAEACAFG